MEELFSKIAAKIKRDPYNLVPYEDYYELSRTVKVEDPRGGATHAAWLAELLLGRVPELARHGVELARGSMGLHRQALKLAADEIFDCYMQFLEFEREPRRRFYLPRRKMLKLAANSMQALSDDELDLLGISLPPGVGKALANDTPVLTRNGWKMHGDLVVGDEVIGIDGNYKKVIAVHPKCMCDRMVEFTNGERIVCHENHEWLIHDRPRHAPYEKDYVAETKYIEKRSLDSGGQPGHRGHRYSIQLPHRGYVVGEEKTLVVDPYTLGVWLGDGVNKMPTICCAESDRAVIDRVVANGNPIQWHTVHKTTGVLYFGFGFRKGLQSYGMCYSRHRKPKRIPLEYLTASVKQRLDLLAGLLDTDGVLTGSKYLFTTTEPLLRDSFIMLLSTFGWRASVSHREPVTSSSGITGRQWCFVIGFTPDIEIPCELERKRNKEPHKQRALAFKSITKVTPREGNCITVEGDGMYLVGHAMLPTHNSTLAMFFLTWLAGKHPDDPILTGSHSNAFIRGAYDEVLRILDPAGEYNWGEVFPGVAVSNTNAKDCRIDVGRRKRFDSLEFTTVGSGNAGLYRAVQLLYCDDLVSGSEVAMSRERLDKLWNQYTVDLRQRKLGPRCKELHIATRWSVHDILGRLEDIYEGDPRAKFITVSAMDEHDESRFDYPYGLGYTTESLRKQREIMEDVDWRALFMNQPIEREGQLYAPEELQRYFELPEGEPDAIVSVCDTKDRGSDDCVMPVAYVYGSKYYIEAILVSNEKPEVVDELLISCLLRHKVQISCFESNSAGGRVAKTVQEGVKARGGITKIETKYTTQNKETKIHVNSPWVKEHCLFKDDSVASPEYRRAVSKLCAYSTAGKNKHDDVPDAFAQLAIFAESMGGATVTVVKRPF